MRGLEALEDVRQEVRADRQGRRDPQGAAACRPEIVDRLAGQRDRAEELLGVRAQGPSRRRQGEPAAAPLEQRDAQ